MNIEQSIKKWRDLSLTISELDTLVAALIAEHEANKKLKKWEPKGGQWYCGAISIDCDPDNWYEQNSTDLGRRYETKAQAEQALIFQRRAMRFFRWCVEYNPSFCLDDMYEFYNLLQDQIMAENLMDQIESGEVEF